MAWVESMRLRRKADIVRAVGWVNLLLSIVWNLGHASDGVITLALGALWAGAVLAVTHGIAWMIDRHAERVVGR